MSNAPNPPKLLDQLRDTIRRRHMSMSTERSYVYHVAQFIFFYRKRQGQFVHPRNLSATDIRTYLSHLAIDKQVVSGRSPSDAKVLP